MTLKNTIVELSQTILPHHLLSQIVSKFTHCENVTWKNFLTRQIIQRYGVNMNEAAISDLNAFKSFNHFFTRELKSDVRPLTTEKDAIASPADGVVSQAGKITNGDIFQAKGKRFTVTDLLGSDSQRAEKFNDGEFTTIYLSPKDYHRLHMPISGSLREMIHVPGRLFSVNSATTEAVDGLFAKNERVVAIFDTEIGQVALVLVGAIFVSSIETIWHGVVTPPSIKTVRTWKYEADAPTLKMGDEMGRFNMGSTIIVLFEKDKMAWNADLSAGKSVKVGEKIGIQLNKSATS
jgi:phosphatidylserine decarboxylase